ncbi:hypothetical protein [Paenibacillus sp. CMAA1364]
MRIPPTVIFRSKLTAFLVLGIIIGSILYNTIYHASYNSLWQENQDLLIRIKQYELDNNSLKKYSNRQTVIKEIKIRAEQQDPPLDSLIEKDILLKVSKDVEVLRGRSVYEIDTDSKLTRALLHRKTYIARDKDYIIQIKTMLVADSVLQIWISISVAVR